MHHATVAARSPRTRGREFVQGFQCEGCACMYIYIHIAPYLLDPKRKQTSFCPVFFHPLSEHKRRCVRRLPPLQQAPPSAPHCSDASLCCANPAKPHRTGTSMYPHRDGGWVGGIWGSEASTFEQRASRIAAEMYSPW